MIDGRKGITNTTKKSIFYLPQYVTMKKEKLNRMIIQKLKSRRTTSS